MLVTALFLSVSVLRLCVTNDVGVCFLLIWLHSWHSVFFRKLFMQENPPNGSNDLCKQKSEGKPPTHNELTAHATNISVVPALHKKNTFFIKKQVCQELSHVFISKL